MIYIVFIVEGWSDYDQIKGAFPNLQYGDYKLDVIVTNGTKFNNNVVRAIDYHQKLGNRIYILSDPDEAGDQLANMINREYPSIPRIHVDPDQAKYLRGKGGYRYGVEYCSHRYLRELLGGYINDM